MVHVVDPASVIHSPLPTDGKMIPLKRPSSTRCNETIKNHEDDVVSNGD